MEDASRLDHYLAAHHLVGSRTLAQKVIRAGVVYVNEAIEYDVARLVLSSDVVKVTSHALLDYVSQGALKLIKAIQTFGVSFHGLRVWDIGASTGGFTQCALEYGASVVYATDVGHEQLHPTLRQDPRVRVYERLNVKDVTASLFDSTQGIDCAVCDLSFISLRAVFPVLSSILPERGWAICLVKPQFEMGAKFANKRGVVVGIAQHEKILQATVTHATECSLQTTDLTFSPLGDGKTKNIEYLLLLQRNQEEKILDKRHIEDVVRLAHQTIH
jgi:ftsJ-like methyltransferase